MRSNSRKAFELTESMLHHTFAFLKNIQAYASKGNHSTFTKTDASRCLVYTYLVLGDILDYYVNNERVTKKLGNPYEIKNGIQKYGSRKDLLLEDIVKEARQEILFVSVSHETLARFKKSEILESIKSGVRMTVMVLNPDSAEVPHKQTLFGRSAGDLRSVIQKQIIELCIQRKEFENGGIDLVVKTYDSPLTCSYIVVDPRSENPLIKLEEHTASDDHDDRCGKLAYKCDNPTFYEEHCNEVKCIENTKVYDCKEES